MRIRAVEIAWFRGSAVPVALELAGRSAVIYGENGSGKSSFVDAMEYVLHDGKIGHLSHEYSGKNQEKGVLNSHTPAGMTTGLKIRFADGSVLEIEIAKTGAFTMKGAETIGIATWDYRRIVLRQDEVAAFVRSTKGEKYSALLPLLGLGPMELAAENLRQIGKALEQVAEIKECRTRIKDATSKGKLLFGEELAVVDKLENLHLKYRSTKAAAPTVAEQCANLKLELADRVSALTGEQKKHMVLGMLAEIDLKSAIGAVRTSTAKLAGIAELLVEEKLGVLENAVAFAAKIGDAMQLACPACGRLMSTLDFRLHVDEEKQRLQSVIALFGEHRAALSQLSDTVKAVKTAIGKSEIYAWKASLGSGILHAAVDVLDAANPSSLRTECPEAMLQQLEHGLLPILELAVEATKNAPTEASELTSDQRIVDAAEAVLALASELLVVERVEAAVGYLGSIERAVRDEIRSQSQLAMEEISAHVQRMWAILHPDLAIEEVRLYQPDDSDKAVDIELKFHGKAQNSPRLTLSEGYRNSLGLCIFLAMAKRDPASDRPVLLDDVVVSFDRNHRGMIVDLLEQEFSERQVVVLTHDREWYTELRQRLNEKTWSFKALMPYGEPVDGIRWSTKTSTFPDARAHLKNDPDVAGNTARKIMDIELATLAERLKIRLPYRHSFKNDHRMSHEFLERLIADGGIALEIKNGASYRKYSEAIELLGNADKLLSAWGNKGSHSFDVMKNEATKLIDACEMALESLVCTTCDKAVHKFGDGSDLQCSCGQLRWRCGKI